VASEKVMHMATVEAEGEAIRVARDLEKSGDEISDS